MNVIQCYTLTNDNHEDNNDQFYAGLQSIIEKCSSKDLTISMEHLNAKVENGSTKYKDIMR